MNEYIDDLLKLASIGVAALNKAAAEGVSEEDYIAYLGQDLDTVKMAIEETIVDIDKEADQVPAVEESPAENSDQPDVASDTEAPVEREADLNDPALIKLAALEILNQSNEAQRKALDLLRMLDSL